MNRSSKTYSATQLAKELNIEPITVGKIFASMKCLRAGKRYNVGLKIKSTSRGVANPDWAQYVSGKWQYGECARTALNEYVRQFPKIVAAIANSGGSIDFDGDFTDDELLQCYAWTKNFREEIYRRVDVNSGEDVTGLR